MKHEGYSKSWRVGLQGMEPGYHNEEITRRVFLTILKSEAGLAAADRVLLEDAPRLAEEVERLRAVLNGTLTDIQTARRIAYEGGNIENTLAVTVREIQNILEGRE